MTERVLETVVEERPEDADVLFYEGELYQRRDEFEEAEEAYKQVLAADSEYAQAYLRLGALAEKHRKGGGGEAGSENLRAAARWYGQYHEVVPDDLLGLKRLVEVCGALDEAGLEDEDCMAAGEKVRVGSGEGERPGAVLWRAWREKAAVADPEYQVGQGLDDGWTLVGYDVDEERLIRGEPVDLLLYWTGVTPANAGAPEDGWYQAGDRWVQVLEGKQNLVLNGGFELGYLEEGSPTGFPYDIYDADSDTRRVVTDRVGGERTTVALLDNTQVDSRTSFASAYLSVDTDSLYLQAGWVKSEGGNGYLGRRWMGDIEEGVRPYDYVAAGITVDEWEHYAKATQPLGGAERCQVWLLNWKSLGRVYFDQISLVEIGLPGQ
jgi:tetratricopeptide (TPR) repeat protein